MRFFHLRGFVTGLSGFKKWGLNRISKSPGHHCTRCNQVTLVGLVLHYDPSFQAFFSFHWARNSNLTCVGGNIGGNFDRETWKTFVTKVRSNEWKNDVKKNERPKSKGVIKPAFQFTVIITDPADTFVCCLILLQHKLREITQRLIEKNNHFGA